MWQKLLLALLHLILHVLAQQRYVSVSTSKGTVQGTRMDYGNDRQQLYFGAANCFLGIPYARAPTGQLRFQEPQQTRPFAQVYDASYLRGRCPQTGSPAGPISEDCLFLNVFSNNVGNGTLAAVMVFIAGEDGLSRGGANAEDIPGTIRNLVMRGVVVVTVQYRLGALGFLAAPAAGIPANLGMLDQVMALQWIKAEIRNFGGNPDRITLCGHADGACAVAALSYSPLAQNLFQQAVLQSGGIYTCYADRPQGGAMMPPPVPSLNYHPGLPYTPIGGSPNDRDQPQPNNQRNNLGGKNEQGNQFGVQLNQGQDVGLDGGEMDPSQEVAMQLCNITAAQWRNGDLGRLRPCLQSLSVDIFIQMQGSKQSKWLVVRDNSFLPASLDQLSSALPSIPLIIGTVQDEDADYAFKLVADGRAAKQNKEQLFNGWFVDFAKKNKMNGQTAEEVKNIIASNYNISGGDGSTPNNYYNNGMKNGGVLYDQQGGQRKNNNQYINSNNENGNLNGNGGLVRVSPQRTASGKPPNRQQYTNLQMTEYMNAGGIPEETESLRLLTRISSDAYGISQSVSQLTALQASGSRVRLYQFTHVSELGRQNLPSLGTWKPVFRGQDNMFLFMTESVWRSGQPSAADFRAADELGNRWTQFAKNGQVAGWHPSPPNQFNYCNINSQPIMQANYASQARRVFNDQVYPLVKQNKDRADVLVQSEGGGPDSWSVSFSIPYNGQPLMKK